MFTFAWGIWIANVRSEPISLKCWYVLLLQYWSVYTSWHILTRHQLQSKKTSTCPIEAGAAHSFSIRRGMWKLNLNRPSSKIPCAYVAVTNNVHVGYPSLSSRHNSTVKCPLHASLFAQFLAGRTHKQKSSRIKIKYLWEKWSHPGSAWGCPSSPYSLPVMNEDP